MKTEPYETAEELRSAYARHVAGVKIREIDQVPRLIGRFGAPCYECRRWLPELDEGHKAFAWTEHASDGELLSSLHLQHTTR